MAEVSRLAGALLAETEGRFFLVGNTKEPCDWRAAGLEQPEAIDAVARPFIELHPRGAVNHRGLRLRLAVEGDALPRVLAERLLVRRNGSVSERLWHVIVGGDPEEPPVEGSVDAGWLGELPETVWEIVRDSVLRCL